jgi:hypothetical protein
MADNDLGREALDALGSRTVQPLVSVLDYFIACHQASAISHGGVTPPRDFGGVDV